VFAFGGSSLRYGLFCGTLLPWLDLITIVLWPSPYGRLDKLGEEMLMLLYDPCMAASGKRLLLRQAEFTLEPSRQAIVTVGELETDTEQTTGRIDHTVHNRHAGKVRAVDGRL
jgi:hypothetical protein